MLKVIVIILARNHDNLGHNSSILDILKIEKTYFCRLATKWMCGIR